MLTFKPAKVEDCKLLFDWRNDEITRKNSISSDIIPFENHVKWFNESLKNKNRKIYIVFNNNTTVGTTRVDIENKKNIISWTIAPSARGKGYGKLMVKSFVDMLNGEIIAIIKENNTASIKIAEFAGLKLDSIKDNVLAYKLIKE